MIRLVVVDVDGCLSAGEGKPFDLAVLKFIADLNDQAYTTKEPFAITLCTGRPGAYVDAVAQAIHAYMPAIFESGVGFFDLNDYRFLLNPAVTPELRAAYKKVRDVVEREIVAKGLGQIQPGKEVSLTLHPIDPQMTFEELAEATRRALNGSANDFSISASVTSVEIRPRAIDKGVGVEWLARGVGISLAEIAGIGDADGDLSFLERVGYSAAPTNATDAVKRAVNYVSPFEYGKGVVDILKRLLQRH